MSSDLLPSGANLITAAASDLQNLLQLGDLTSVRLVEQCLAQIEKHDRRPGSMELRAMMFITRKEKLLEIAKLLDEERKLGYLRGPLHGIPVLLKVRSTAPASFEFIERCQDGGENEDTTS